MLDIQRSAGASGHANGAQTGEQQEDNPPAKRRPGRPRGSKNRSKCKSTSEPASSNQQQSTSTSVNPQNKQYYEFQWRVLNLCAEFYGAAEELVVSPFYGFTRVVVDFLIVR